MRKKMVKSGRVMEELNSATVSVPFHIASRTVENEELIVCLKRGIYYGLNDTGSFIWRELQNKTAFGQVAGKLAEAYGLSREQALQDVVAVVKDLKANQLVEIVRA